MEIGALKKDDFVISIPFIEDSEVLIRYVSREELQEIKRNATKISWDRKNEPSEEFDSLRADLLLGRAAVRGWKGLTMNGEEFPYSPENCDLLMRKWTEFAKFVGEASMDIARLQEEGKKGRLGKS
jgi:hypothetical protein